jgi:hypothetical protein
MEAKQKRTKQLPNHENDEGVGKTSVVTFEQREEQ